MLSLRLAQLLDTTNAGLVRSSVFEVQVRKYMDIYCSQYFLAFKCFDLHSSLKRTKRKLL